jgi:heme-degrading monooxygenase HmoA
MISKTPKPPYYAVIFTSVRTTGENNYSEIAAQMAELSAEQDGFLGMEHAAGDGLSITVCYWNSLDAIAVWRENSAHKLAQQKGYEEFYEAFTTRICKVERDNQFVKPNSIS